MDSNRMKLNLQLVNVNINQYWLTPSWWSNIMFTYPVRPFFYSMQYFWYFFHSNIFEKRISPLNFINKNGLLFFYIDWKILGNARAKRT